MNDLDLFRCLSCASGDNRFYELGGEGLSPGEFADDTILSEDIIFPNEDRR